MYSIDGFYNQDSNNLFQRYNTRAAIKHFKQFDSVITLSQNVIDDFASSQQKTVSITPIESDLYKDESSNVIDTSKVKLLFTGGVAELNGINQYLEAMKYLPKNFELTIYGRGVLVDKVIESSKTDSRIIYGGVMIKSDVIKKQTESDILLIVRPMINGEQNNITKYGIPYKLIEYLASGTPIIASDMLAIPHSLRRFINFTETNPQSIAKSIESVVGNYKHHKKLALEARNTMINYHNWNYYYEILKDFINE